MKPSVLAAILCAAFAGCAGTASQPEEPRIDPIYRTGSRLPVKDGTAASAKTMDKSSVEAILRPNPVPGTSGN